jgi:hypothetical protein
MRTALVAIFVGHVVLAAEWEPSIAAENFNLLKNYNCENVEGFSKCCHEFSHPGTCYRVNATETRPEEACKRFCQTRGAETSRTKCASKTKTARVLADSKLTDKDTHPTEFTECQGDGSSRRLGDDLSSSSYEKAAFCPLKQMYFLDDLDPACYSNPSRRLGTIPSGSADLYKKQDETHCSFFDYNPQTRVCCIPEAHTPPIPSFNRYTVAQADTRRRLGSGNNALLL